MAELADTSAWAQRRHPEVRTWFDAALVAGEIVTCDIVALELLRGVAPWGDYQVMEQSLTGVPWIRMDQHVWDRVFEIQRLLASQLHAEHRSVKVNDFLVAATAELASLTVLHYDQDFDTIAAATGQPARWIAPRGRLG